MEDNKYYKPDLEDLFVGYECEHTTVTSAFRTDDIDSIKYDQLYSHELIDIIKWVNEDGEDLSQFIRTPYLTPEQTENEGWKYIAMIMLVNDNIIFKKGKSQLRYDPIEHTGEITTEIDGKDFIKLTKTLYDGKIKSINELRKIEKLLEI